jgi:signal transduction histidine kinase
MEPFFTTKKDVGGTGLGLYISYSIVKDHQGSMDILSEAGKGTEVILKFPALKIPDINNKGAYDAGDIS